MRPGPADLRRPADHPLTSRAGVTSTPAPTERTTTVTRPRTPDVQNPNGSTTITMKRACNGCHQTLGDVTTKEMLAGMNGLPLPDVRPECPNCQAEYPVPECRPMTLSVGLTECGERECEEYLHEDGEDNGLDRCSHLHDELFCVEHSTLYETDEGEHGVDEAEPWPCQHDPNRAAAAEEPSNA